MSCFVLVVVVNLYLTRVIPSEYLKVYLLSIGALKLGGALELVGWHATERQCRETLEVRAPLLFAPLITYVAIVFPLAHFA